MDVFGKYVAQRAASAARYAQVRAQQQAFAQQAAQRAAQRAAGNVVQQVAAPAVRQVASGGGGGGGGWSGVGQAAAQAVQQGARQAIQQAAAQVARGAAQQAAANPAIFTPAPPVETFGQRMARAIVENAERAQQVAAPPSPPSFQETFVSGLNRQQQPGQITQLAGFQQEPQAQQPEPWQVYRTPEGNPVAMPSSYQAPEGWTPTGGQLTDPTQIDRARTSPYGYDQQDDATRSQIVIPGVDQASLQIQQETGNERRLDQQAIAGLPAPKTQDASGLGANIMGIVAQQANDVLAQQQRQPKPLRPRGVGPDEGAPGGGLNPNDPYVTVRSGRTGKVYTIDRARAANLGPGDVILGTAGTQPESSRDRGANDGIGEVWDTVTDTVSGVWDTTRRTVQDLATIGKVISRNPQVTTALEGIWNDFAADWNERGPAAAIVNILKDGAGVVLDASDVARELNTQNAIDAYIKLKTGQYDPAEEEELADAAGLLTLTVTGMVQNSLGMVDIRADEERGVVTAGSVGFPDWYGGTSTVVYEDGTVYTVRNQDIGNNPDVFAGATVISNEERANTAYTEGIDTDGDGVADTFGAEAVQLIYEADQGIGGTFIWTVGMDPLTYIPFVTIGGAKVQNIGRAVRARSATQTGEGVGRVIEAGGAIVRAGATALDEASSLGAGIVLDKVVAPLIGRVGRSLRLLNESNVSRQITEQAEAGAVAGGIANNANDPRVTGGEGAPSVVGGTTARAASEGEREAVDQIVGPDRRTTGGEGAPSVLRGNEEPPLEREGLVTERPSKAVPTFRESGAFDRGPDLRTPDGGTIATRVADGEGGTVVRSVDETGIRAVSREDSTFPVREVRTPAGRLDASGVPPRYDELLVRSARDSGLTPTQTLVDTWRATGRFIDNVTAQRTIGAVARTSEGTVDAALRTASDAFDWQRDLRGLNPATPAPRFVPSQGQGADYGAAQRIIGQPWGASTADRNRLYRLPTDSPNAIRKGIPANPTAGDLAAAERYADLVDAHLTWHPLDINDASYVAARKQAARIRQQLADLGYAGRRAIPTRSAAPALGTNGRAPAVDGANVTPGTPERPTATNGAQPNGSRATSDSDLGTVGGYPVDDEFATAHGLGLSVRLDADTTAMVVPIPLRDVLPETRRAFPDFRDEPTWHRGTLIDDSVETGTVVQVAPDPDTVVARLADDARARGLLDETQPAPEPTPTPEPTPAPTPIRATGSTPRPAAPNGQTPATVTAAPTPIRATTTTTATPAATATDLPVSLREAISEGVIGDEATARALLTNLAVPRRWTDDDLRLVLGSLREMRRAEGFEGPLFDAIDLANPATKQWVTNAETLARQTYAVRVNENVVRHPGATKAAKSGANARLKQLRIDLAETRTRLGLGKEDGTVTAATRRRLATEDDATTLLGRLTPPGKRERAYLQNLRKLRTLEHGAPARGLTLDRTGMTYFHGAILTDDEIAVLTRHTFENGDTFLDRWNVYLNDVVDNGRVVSLQGSDPIRTALDMTMRDYRELVEGLFPAREVPKWLKPLATYTRYLREKILGSWLSGPRYVGTQALGNTINLGLSGYGGTGWVDMLAGVRRSWRETHEMGRLLGADAFDYDRTILNSDRLAVKWGTSRAPEIRRHVSSETDIMKDAGVVEGWFRRHDLPGARAAAAVFGDTRLIKAGGAFDMAARDTVYSIAFGRRIRQNVTEFRLEANRLLMDAGLTRRQAVETVETFKRLHPDGFTANDVRAFFRDYVGEGKAERLGRDWQGRVNATTKHARDEVKRITFAGGETKLDAALKTVVLFHYFMSRQYLFLIRQALHHPGLINAYEALTTALEDYAEAADLPPWLEGTIQFVLAGPGMALYLNPAALLQIGNLFSGADDIFEADTWLGEQLDSVGEYLFLNPILTDALNLFGFLGNDRDLDPFRLFREAQLFQTAFNWGVVTGWIPGEENLWLGNPVTNLGNRIRAEVSGLLPGSETVDFVDEAEAEQRELQALIVDEAVAAGIDPNTPEGAAQIAAIIEDPTDPIHKRAQERYLWGETYAIGARLIPIVASFQPQVRPVNREGGDLITNRTDAERSLSNTTDPRALRVKTQAAEYYTLGSDDIRNVDFIYQDLVYSQQVFFDVTIDGVTYDHEQIEDMTAEERRMLGQAFLAQYGQRERWQAFQAEQDAFLADPANREFAQYRTWGNAVRDYPGGPEQYWRDLIEQNENARAYYEGLDPNLSAKERQRALTGTWAFYAAAGIAGSSTVALKPTNGYDPVNVANAPAQPIIPEPYVNQWQQDVVEEVDAYQRYRSEAEVVLQQIYADWGLPPETSLGTVPYKTRQAIEKEYKARTGYYPPEPGSKAEKYFRWRDEHPGATIEDYFAWNDAQYEQNLPATFNEEQARPDGAERETDAYDLWNRDEFRGD